jgi:SpoVK/Ycf46/Vps4 family AAA+-type ATPase
MGDPTDANLSWSDFTQLQPSADRLAVFLQKSCEMGLKGVNVLLHGPPGTGKTEFTKTIADHLGMTLYSIGEVDDEGDEPTRNERLSSLRLAQNLLQDQKNCLLLFDEMDDLFESPLFSFLGGSRSRGSKVFGNRLLENNPIPIVWTINNPELLEPSILRRMSFAIEIKTPPVKGRQEVWARLLDKHGVVIQPEELKRLADQDDVSPAIAENAIRFASLSGGNAEDIQFAAEGIIQVMSGHRPKKLSRISSETFLPELTQADIDLAYLTDRLTKTVSDRGFSLCFYGPSGTGKSAFGRHLAERMGMEVLYKRASDILDMYVGNSEKNIARMFQQAREEEKLLILDEADSLLSERSGAQRSWEVSQVNEMLTWMEDHPLPFICTTNLMDALDQASLRRFTFKIQFDYLTKEQVLWAFRHFFNQELPVGVDTLSHVTPGDFMTVRRKSNILGHLEDPVRLTRMLVQEQQVKSVARSVIGFA